MASWGSIYSLLKVPGENVGSNEPKSGTGSNSGTYCFSFDGSCYIDDSGYVKSGKDELPEYFLSFGMNSSIGVNNSSSDGLLKT